jgi:hypothetical protein
LTRSAGTKPVISDDAVGVLRHEQTGKGSAGWYTSHDTMSDTLTTTFEFGGAVTRSDGGDSATETSPRLPVAEALGQSLRVRPWLWLAATLGVAAFLWSFAETASPQLNGILGLTG